ncbi:ribonucleoside-diphosphate reductase beta chain [Rhizobium azibense]|nr:ribonucleoside-diphosphate reductase beta chain [Rhizobium azibense]
MLFEPQVERLPDHYPWAQSFIEAMQEGFWTAKKFTFDRDATDYELHMTDAERQVVSRCLAAIAQIEVAVKKFWARLGDHLPHPSITDLGITMGYIEVIHNNAYEKLLKKLGLSHVFKENMSVPALAGRVGYLTKHNDKVYGDDKKQYIYSLILFTLFVENVSLFSQFFIILHLNRFHKLLSDAAQQVKYTRNEELLHAQAGTKIINTLRQEYPELFDDELERRVVSEAREALKAEEALIDWMVGDYSRSGFEQGKEYPLNAEILKHYVAERLNSSLVDIGFKAQFAVPVTLPEDTFWMISGQLAPAKVDFFDTEPTSYQQADQPDEDEF